MPQRLNGRGVRRLMVGGNMNWRKSRILSGLELSGQRVSGEVGVILNDSSVTDCAFEGVVADGTLWRSQDVWERCTFVGSALRNMVSPGNTFKGCTFEGTTIDRWTGYETQLSDCRFSNVTFRGMTAQKSTARGRPFATAPEESLVFQRCTFVQPVFVNCRLAHVAFIECNVITPSVEDCSFVGAKGAPEWWSAFESGDPFLAFIREAAELAITRLGQSSEAYRRFSAYVHDYESGSTTKRDYSGSVYVDQVSDAEVDVMDQIFDELREKYPDW